jgi:heme/copper-type cytochrome/quinol oxidase subunit 4
MQGYIFQIIFLIVIIFISYKMHPTMLSNYIIGFILLVFFTNLSFEPYSLSRGEIPIFMINIFLYTVLFLFSLFIYFDEGNEKRHYALFTVIGYLVIIILEVSYIRFANSFFYMFLPISLAFFPLYIFKYYKKYKKSE